MRREERPGPGKGVSQASLGDELDFALATVKEVGFNDANMPTALELASEIIQRATGSDIPDDILAKVGAVLNTKNNGRLNQIRQLAQEVLDSAGTDEDDGKQAEPPLPQPTQAEITAQRAVDVAEVASLVVKKLQGKRIK